MNTIKKGRSYGFSLLEVLIAVVIMSFGLLALANLQGTLMRASGYTKAQSTALSLAKDVLESQRDFVSTAGYQALTDGTTFPDGTSTKSLGGVDYTITTTVDRYAFQSDPDGDPTTDDGGFTKFATDTGALGTGYTATNEFKRVSVTVNWSSVTGDAESITVEDAIGGLPPENTGKLVRRKADSSNRGPKVIIEDPGNQSGVIPIAVGNGSETAATNPRPEIAGNKNKALQEVQFDIYTYAAINGTDNAQAQSRVETYVVGCKCDASSSAISGLTNDAFRPTYWDGEKYAEPQAAGYKYKAAEGDLGNGASAEGVQSQICDRCCGEHHDPASSAGPKFSPRLKAHDHYNWDYTTGALVDGDTSDSDIDPSNNGVYYEACRLIRVNGIIRTAADPYNSYYNLLKTETEFTGFNPDSTAALNYESFVKAYIDSQYRQGSDSTYNTDLTDSAANALADSKSINLPATLALEESDEAWFHARGLYVDYLESEARTALSNAKNNCDEGTTDAAKLVCTLEVLPFTSINLTEISDWEPATPGESGIDQLVVTLQAFDLSDAANNFLGSDPIRGLGTALSPGSVNATGKVRTSTSGLLADPNYLVHPDTVVNEKGDTVTMLESDAQAIIVTGTALGGSIREAIDAGGAVKGETNEASDYDGTASLTTIDVEVQFGLSNTLGKRDTLITLVGPSGGNCEFTLWDGSSNETDTSWTLSVELNAGDDDIGGDCDPSVDGTWVLVITSEANQARVVELRWRMSLSLSRKYTIEWTGDYAPPAASGSWASVNTDTGASCTSESLSGSLRSNCYTTADSEATKLTLGKYNYQVNGSTGTASCTKSNGSALSCPSVTLQVCKNFSVDSLTSSNASATVGSATVLNEGKITETTVFAVDPIQPDDVITALLSEGASIPATCAGNNCGAIVWTCP